MKLPVVFFLLCCQTAAAQFFPNPGYPQQYFRDPLDIPITLAGNFGELRPNHYHMGLDIKTGGHVNEQVYAAADGYIARIKIEPGGFGRAIYINHPNGLTTLYAHLNDFNPALESWVKQQQYRLESWSVFLEVPPNLFPVKKGDFLAWSGTTGGSQAPHLHFEIRQTAGDINLNPFLFGLPLTDNISPHIVKLAVYNRTKSVYEQSPRIVPVKAIKGTYTTVPALITVASPLISFAVGAFDTHNGSANHIGIFEGDLYVDEQPVTAFRMDKISYNDTRNVNAHIDYKTKAARGPYLQQFFNLPGYHNSIYSGPKTDGIINLSDKKIHPVRIVVKDAYGNTSTLNIKVQYNGAAVKLPVAAARLFHPDMLDGYEATDCEFYVGEHCLYDSVHISYSKSVGINPNRQVVSAAHTIGTNNIPLQDALLIRIQPDRPLADSEKLHTVMQWFSGGSSDVAKVEWKANWATARFRTFGSFQLVIDTVPPVITPLGFAEGASLGKATRIMFAVKDNLGAYKNVRAELDGKWLRFTNDKGRAFTYLFDEKCLPGPHILTIKAEDEAGKHNNENYSFH